MAASQVRTRAEELDARAAAVLAGAKPWTSGPVGPDDSGVLTFGYAEHEGRIRELPQVWCENDASNAVAVIDGTGYCATCFPVAVAETIKAGRL